MRRLLLIVPVLLGFLMAVAATRGPLQAAETGAPAGTLEVSVGPATGAEKALVDRSYMVSVIRDGQVVKQTEGFPKWNTLPVGLYDVRCEGEGMQTIVKRGIHVTPDGDTRVRVAMRPGQGVRIIEYAVGGLAREEVAARLQRLEAAVAKLQK